MLYTGLRAGSTTQQKVLLRCLRTWSELYCLRLIPSLLAVIHKAPTVARVMRTGGSSGVTCILRLDMPCARTTLYRLDLSSFL